MCDDSNASKGFALLGWFLYGMTSVDIKGLMNALGRICGPVLGAYLVYPASLVLQFCAVVDLVHSTLLPWTH